MSDYDLWFVWAGRGTLVRRGRAYPLHAGAVFCLRPGEAVRATHDQKNRLGVCYVHFDFADRRGRAGAPAERPAFHAVLADVAFYEALLRRAVEWSADPGRRDEVERLVESVLLAMRAAAARPALRVPRHADRVLPLAREIRQNPGHGWTVPRLAEKCGVSVDHFTRLFRAATGANPKAFVIRARVERARSLLRDSPAGLETIARMLGYADAFAFSKQFTRLTGVSPSAWRAGRG